MKKNKPTLLLILFLSFSLIGFSADTTLLQKRIARINSLLNDFKPLDISKINRLTDSAIIIEYYKALEQKYFNPPFKHSEFPIYTVLFRLNNLANEIDVKEFPLRPPDAKKDSITNVSILHRYLANTVIMYFPMYNDEWEGFYFAFKDGTDQLFYLLEAGGEPNLYRRKKHFINTLYSQKIEMP